METMKQKLDNAYKALKDQGGYANKLAAPRLQKIVISVGTGKRAKVDREFQKHVAERLAKITGQKPSATAAKKSIAGFKIRTGDPVGQYVTLRGARMNDFLDKLIHIALPRTKDFRGLSRDSVDAIGNLTFGIREHTIFPETANEDVRDVFSLAVTLVSTAGSKKAGQSFYEYLGVPFKK